MKKDERKAPVVAIKPPANAVFRIPKRSTRTPEIGDIRNVVPINNDPTKEAFVSEFSLPSKSYLFLKAT